MPSLCSGLNSSYAYDLHLIVHRTPCFEQIPNASKNANRLSSSEFRVQLLKHLETYIFFPTSHELNRRPRGMRELDIHAFHRADITGTVRQVLNLDRRQCRRVAVVFRVVYDRTSP
jgi:hypothetical protein